MAVLKDLLYDIQNCMELMEGEPFEYAAPKQLVAVEKRLSRMEERAANAIEDIDLDALYGKTREILSGKGKESLSGREIRSLPFILNQSGADVSFVKEVVQRYLKLDSVLVFRRMLNVYFNSYEESSAKTQYLKTVLSATLRAHPGMLRRIPYLRKETKLLYKDMKVMATGFLNAHGVQAYLQDIEFPESLYSSRFVMKAIIHAFQTTGIGASLLMELLRDGEELYNQLNLFPFIAEPLILAVDRSGDSQYREELTKCLFRYMKDPRYENRNQWSRVGLKARKIFLSWLCRNDFEIFFGLIERTAGSTSVGDRMWRYRRAFWEAYLDDMYYTRVVLGPAALRLARVAMHKEALNYAILTGIQDSTQSLLMFSIGKYTFIEVSHNGKLRVFETGKEPIPFIEENPLLGKTEYSYRDLVQDHRVVFTQVHSGAASYSWQMKVSSWIASHCSIYHNRRQWSLK